MSVSVACLGKAVFIRRVRVRPGHEHGHDSLIPTSTITNTVTAPAIPFESGLTWFFRCGCKNQS